MSDTSLRRGTRRNPSTQPMQGRPTGGQKVNHSPISPDELAFIIERARAQRDTEDNALDQRKKSA